MGPAKRGALRFARQRTSPSSGESQVSRARPGPRASVVDFRMPRHKNEKQLPSRRAVLKSMGLAPLLLRPAPFAGYSFIFCPPYGVPNRNAGLPFSDVRLTPHYPVASPLEDVLRLVAPGSDEYITEKYAWEIESLLKQWGRALKASVRDLAVLAKSLDPSIEASPLVPANEITLRTGMGISTTRRLFNGKVVSGRE